MPARGGLSRIRFGARRFAEMTVRPFGLAVGGSLTRRGCRRADAKITFLSASGRCRAIAAHWAPANEISPMKLLVAEDEPKTGIYVQQGLAEAGYSVDRVTSGAEALQHALGATYDLLILDVMIPGLDGWEVLRRVRAAGRDVPVLFLTARDRVEDRVKGLELGADDYLVKPFAFSELLARVRTLLRRGQGAAVQTRLCVADLQVDLLKRRAMRGGQRIDLTAKEFALLELLLRRRGEVLPKSLIASQVWDMNFDSDTNVIEVAIRRLRVKIDDGFEPKLIHTARGMGYMLDEPDAL